MANFATILTNIGLAKISNAIALGQQIALTEMAVGDGNGAPTSPVQTQEALVNEVYRGQLNRLDTDPDNAAYVIAELVVPANVGGWYVHEVGVFDADGDLIAIANFPATYKPQALEGSTRDLVVRVYIEVTNAAAVQLKIDTSIVLASRAWVVDNFLSLSSIGHAPAFVPRNEHLVGGLANERPAIYVAPNKLKILGTHVDSLSGESEYQVGRRAFVVGDSFGAEFCTITGVTESADTVVTVTLDNEASLVDEDLKIYLVLGTDRGLPPTAVPFHSDRLQPVLSRIKADVLDHWSGRSLCILGDSISHGANVTDIHHDSWVGILRKLANLEYGSTNQGFVSLKDKLVNAAGSYQEVHTVVRAGNWAEVAGAAATDLINGFGLTSSTVGDSLTITVPTFARYCRIWYHKKVGGGIFDIAMNGGATAASIDTSAASAAEEDGAAVTFAVNLVDDGTGECHISLTVASGSVTLLGLSYVDVATEFALNNFSQSGRTILDTSPDVIDVACKASHALIWALGHNDQGLAGAEQDLVSQRIDWLVDRATLHGTKLVIVDFCWGQDSSHWLRRQLYRAALSVPGAAYIPLPDLFTPGRNIVSTADLKDTYGFLSDTSHPTALGHKLVAEVVAKVLGFSHSSKKSAEMFDHVWRPLKLLNGWTNSFSDNRYVSAWRRNGNSLQLRLYINKGAKTSDTIATLPNRLEVPFTWRSIEASNAGLLYGFQAALGFGGNLTFSDIGGIADTDIEGMMVVPINCVNDFERFR